MSIEISRQIEIRLASEAQKHGISVDALLERLLTEHSADVNTDSPPSFELPVWHLGGTGALHRRDIYDDAR